MKRTLVFVLVLGNILVFSLSAGWFGSAGDAATTPVEAPEAHVPLSPDRIRIVSRGEPPPIVEPPKQCLEWRDLPSTQIAALEKLAAGNKALSLVRDETQASISSYWVFIPAPAGGRVASEKKANELKTLGIKEFQLVQESTADHWSISLGVYDSEADAAAGLAAFKKSGVRSAKLGLKAETPARFRVRLSGVASALAPARRLSDLAAPGDCEGEPGAAGSPVTVPAAVVATGAAAPTPVRP